MANYTLQKSKAVNAQFSWNVNNAGKEKEAVLKIKSR
jgi:hypothetical protein